MIRYLIILMSLTLFRVSYAQEIELLTAAEVVYEKRINRLAILRLMASENSFYAKAYQEAQASDEKVILVDYTLQFDTIASRYFPSTSNPQNKALIDLPGYASTVSVVNNFLSDSLQVQKEVFDEVYAFNRGKNDILWRITDEYRDILGFSCRRANGMTRDSLYVVAFFTNQIPFFAGPETFGGLPGMILGLALPYEQLSWFAKRIEKIPVAAQERLKKPIKHSDLNSLQDVILNRKLDQAFTLRLLLNVSL